MEISIREALPGDAKALSALLVEIHDLHVTALPGIFRSIEKDDQTEAFLADQMAIADSQMFVAEHTGQIVGYVWVRIQQTPPIHLFVPRRYAEIDTLVVATTHRRQGIGQALADRAQEWAAAQGVDEMRLVVYEFNQDAIRFYERLGFETGRRTMWRAMPKAETAG